MFEKIFFEASWVCFEYHKKPVHSFISIILNVLYKLAFKIWVVRLTKNKYNKLNEL